MLLDAPTFVVHRRLNQPLSTVQRGLSDRTMLTSSPLIDLGSDGFLHLEGALRPAHTHMVRASPPAERAPAHDRHRRDRGLDVVERRDQHLPASGRASPGTVAQLAAARLLRARASGFRRDGRAARAPRDACEGRGRRRRRARRKGCNTGELELLTARISGPRAGSACGVAYHCARPQRPYPRRIRRGSDS